MSEKKTAKRGAKQTPAKKTAEKKIKVLFVCTGNTCRSPMAEYIFKDYLKKNGNSARFRVTSAGLAVVKGDSISPEAVVALGKRGIRAGKRKAVQLTLAAAKSADIIVCMTERHKNLVGGHRKITTVAQLTGGAEVSDPYGGSQAEYDACAEYLAYAAEDVFVAAEKFAALNYTDK